MVRKRVSIVSYLNSKPFLWGLESSPLAPFIELSDDIPSKVASKLVSGKADIGLIPVAALLDLDAYSLVSDYCIGADGKVRTVVIASEVPIDDVGTILMDYQSRTSVMLAKVLAVQFWKRDFKWENTCTGYENKLIGGKTAGVMIGDRVFKAEKKFPYICDLADEWKKFTGLPFVFAVWAATCELTDDFQQQFSKALEKGIQMIPEKLESIYPEYKGIDLSDYFTRNISFRFDGKKKEALALFHSFIAKL